MANLKPGMKEYQAQADFEYIIRRGGAGGQRSLQLPEAE